MLDDLNDTVHASPRSRHGESSLAVRAQPRFRHDGQEVCEVVAGSGFVESGAE